MGWTATRGGGGLRLGDITIEEDTASPSPFAKLSGRFRPEVDRPPRSKSVSPVSPVSSFNKLSLVLVNRGSTDLLVFPGFCPCRGCCSSISPVSGSLDIKLQDTAFDPQIHLID